MTTCGFCFAYVPEEWEEAHRHWHEAQEAAETIAHAHQENLIERMHDAEKKVEALANRMYLMERQPNRDRFPGTF